MKLKFAGMLLLLLELGLVPLAASAQETMLPVESADVDVTSADQAYASYIAAPTEGGPYPGIVLIHSFNGLEDGYKTMVDQLAAEGFVVLAVGWQTFEQSPADDVVNQIVQDSMALLSAREDVNPDLIGLTGFCAGGRYTMLLLPQIEGIKAGVAWYGFPMRGEPAPVALVEDLTAPMLIIHGTEDEPSPIADIYNYTSELMNVGADFEMKIYSGEPHGFMLSGGQLRTDDVATDAFREMADFFKRKLVAE
jgi:carboxymethylenebutenolidase